MYKKCKEYEFSRIKDRLNEFTVGAKHIIKVQCLNFCGYYKSKDTTLSTIETLINKYSKTDTRICMDIDRVYRDLSVLILIVNDNTTIQLLVTSIYISN